MENNKPIINWLLTGCFLIFLMVVIGGITRLTHSGLSMVDWKPVVGSLPPLTEQQWLNEFEKYQQSPEYLKINYHFELNDFKSIFWWEYIHRFLGRLIGVIFLVPFLFFWLKNKITPGLMPKLLLIFALGALQGFLGWYMVKSGLKDVPYVSHYRLALHLITAFTTFGVVFWVALDEIYRKNPVKVQLPGTFRNLIRILVVVLMVQIVYGAFVAGLKAGYVFNTWPKMGEEWIPEAVTSMQPVLRNFLEGLAGVQFIHRYMAYLLVLLTGWLWFKSRSLALAADQKKGVEYFSTGILLQVIIGIFTLIYAVPVALGVIHQAMAFFLLAIGLFLLHRTKRVNVLKIDQLKQPVLQHQG
jgi:cytochrome c oxidase assembly protein subunit 15